MIFMPFVLIEMYFAFVYNAQDMYNEALLKQLTKGIYR